MALNRPESRMSFFFLDASTDEFWPVDDPVSWCLEHARQPVLERASQGLLALTPADKDRIIRLVARRCGLHLMALGPSRVVIHFWVRLADMRPLFKKQGLARPDVAVALCERRHEIITLTIGSEFL